MVGHGVHGIGHPLEVVETVLEVADVAWKAIEHHREHRSVDSVGDEISSLQSENLRLRTQLEENLKLLQHLSQSPVLSKDCPPDLYLRLVATVDSSSFLTQLESLHQAPNNNSPLNGPSVETLINVDLEEPNWWVWVTDEMVPGNTEELSGIDNESYVIINEEQVVDGVANFIAKCIVSNPKSKRLTPEELHKTVMKALGGMNEWEKMRKVWHAGKLIYALSTWGLTFAGLYRHRAVLKVVANGVGASGKAVMKAF
ncbi:uncharacterized protein LOC143848716 [Tasmannia lanceolata]|uniref:uncharacterized protein LOC143848716 n=1 Tax=Tasmannia lanceolata TaxID=3420 RepID=UPI004064778F